jgi:hypothetical protein
MIKVHLQMVWRSSQCYEISDLLKMTAGMKDRELLRTHQHPPSMESLV